ncbi:enoyl-CoA hydratase/isomerase family protein [Amycolatopsis rhizosphaerae]|uniref:Enoyl-CoA hydratase/isomerase family protein n=1 Tax=Amycolatopsis rhizosphaerae TaxID=2053003 RepID=A0A558DJK8_9PSEU|nr:enoyl-CoA hydratase/isomerase family protein [Amycolatopsis rhizosphaerae]TVT61202.1 enoyl-CoA hydratase/isomerase family protein [Amycolatopsis rhizosphaerae]
MAPEGYSTLQAVAENGVLHVVLDNPPVNVLGAVMMREVRDLLSAVREDSSVKVIVFESANPEFFLAHVDIRVADRMDILRDLAASAPEGVNVFQLIGELIRRQPQVTIVKLAGKARGGGAEFVAAADLAFAAEETAALGQVEALMGITPGGGGTQYLRERVGRNRAMEIVLTGDLVDARTAASIGWINRAVPAADLDAYVSEVASKIAALSDGVIAAAKKALPPTEYGQGLAAENDAWAGLVELPAAQRIMGAALVSGAQTPDGERDLETLLRTIAAQGA